MTNKEIFASAFNKLKSRQLGKALQAIHQYMADNPAAYGNMSIHSIEDDYHRMLEYMELGYPDPDRNKIYQRLLQNMWNFTANAHISWLCREVQLYREAQQRSLRHMFTHERIESTLKDFVTETAMLSLEPEEQRKHKETGIYARHHDFMRSLFDRIFVSSQWEQSQYDFYCGLLLSPAVDVIDVQLIISAITMSCLTQFDVQKFRLLVYLHEHATNVEVRERAFVGWAFSLNRLDFNVYPELRKEISDHCQNHVQELIELQRHVICCINADRDNETIQREIMPNLLRNNNFRITLNGIEEIEDDPMDDILHPESADEKAEQLEQDVLRMFNMQKQGSDIYFGGFKQMKRYPFFYTLSNWFTPFYMQHPELPSMTNNVKLGNLLQQMVDKGAFCNSDRYSFLLGISSVINHIPPQLQEAMSSDDGFSSITQGMNTNSPTFVRLNYLQDLYRFFRLHPQHKEIVYDPFMRNLTTDNFFILSHQTFKDFGNSELMLFRAKLLIETGDTTKALDELEEIEQREPENIKCLAMIARIYLNQDSQKAVNYYKRILEIKPDNERFQFLHALSLTQAGEYENASSELYRLSYENPDNIKYRSTLAWALLCMGRDQQAGHEYDVIIKSGKISQADRINAGYCYWFNEDIKQAVALFREFLKSEKDGRIELEFKKDEKLLSQHGINEQDRALMIELVEWKPE